MTRILFTDDEPRILDGLRRMLRSHRKEWEMVFAIEGPAAVSELEAGRFDVVVSDMRMPRMDGVEVLSQAKRLHPDAIRIVLSGHTDQSDAARAASVAHQFIMKPSSPDVVRSVMERVCSLRAQIPDEIRRAVGRVGSFPVAQHTYDALTQALQRPDVSHEPLVQIIAGDPGMAAKVLQAVNSSFFGVSREIADIASAVRMLDPGLLREMVLSGGVFHPFESPVGAGFSAEILCEHSLGVATIAAGDQGPESALYSAGLLHDVGKLVLAETMPEAYAGVLDDASGSGSALYTVERDRLGVTHAQVGAYLLSLWNLPPSLVEVVASHHCADEDDASPAEAVEAIRRAHASLHAQRG